MRTLVSTVCLLLSLVAAVPASWGLAAQYRVVALDALAVLRIDRDTDEVLFVRLVHGQVHGFVGTPQGPPPVDLGLLPDGTFLYPFGGRGGRIVGMGSTGPYGLYTHAFARQAATAGLVDLGTAGGADLVSVATDSNGTEDVGYGTTPTSAELLPFKFVGGTTLLVLGTLGGTTGWINAINQGGESVGAATTADGALHAALWEPSGDVVDLHTLPSGSSVALDINTAGQRVGEVQTPDGPRGFLSTGAGPMVLLQPVSGDTQSSTQAINDAGESVGRCARPGPVADQGHEVACAWDASGTPVDLQARVVNGAEWELRSARGITTAGLIAGVGTFQGAPTGFVLIPLDTRGPKPAQPRPPRPRR